MLVFHAHCQMGNQMFIYACARSLSLKRNLAYSLSDLTYLKYFELAETDKFNKLKYLFFKLQNKLPGFRYAFKHLQDNRIAYASQMITEKSKRSWYYGYFQGESYLFDNFIDIKIFNEYFTDDSAELITLKEGIVRTKINPSNVKKGKK